jgi:hypothetical protein
MMEMKRIVYSSDIGMKYTFKAIFSIYNDDSSVFGDQDVDLSNEMVETELKWSEANEMN